MAAMLEDIDQLGFIDRHIQELEQRIDGLKTRMAAMTLERYDTHNQEVLLIAMLETLKDLEKFRAELVQTAS
jgi:hypothetical protein